MILLVHEILNAYPALILLAAVLYGITMKIADLFNEHGMRWFRSDAILFGILFGLFGAVLVFSGNAVANIILAMVLASLIRMRIDYRNHAIAATIIIISFLFATELDVYLFFVFFIIYLVFGSIRDYIGDKRKERDWIKKYGEFMWYHIVPPFVYGFFTNNWTVFLVLVLYTIAYEITKYGFFYLKFYSKL